MASELECTECGIVTSYADASIADWYRSCDETKRGKHTWAEI